MKTTRTKTREAYMTGEILEDKFDKGNYLIKHNYKDIPIHQQEKMLKKVRINNHDRAMEYIRVAKRFAEVEMQDLIIDRSIHWDMVVRMTQLTDNQVMQILQQIPHHDLKSNRCAISSKECEALYRQVRYGTSVNDTHPIQENLKIPTEDVHNDDKYSQGLIDKLMQMEERIISLEDQLNDLDESYSENIGRIDWLESRAKEDANSITMFKSQLKKFAEE